MTISIDGNGAGRDRFDQIEATLQSYPNIDERELADLKRWFHKEATSFEIASMASKDHLRDQYAAFRADHIDRLGKIEVIFTVLVVIVVLGGLAMVALDG